MKRQIRRIAALLRRTPLHPQWLLGARAVPQGLAQARGMLLDVGAADRWLEGRLTYDVRYVALDYPQTGGVLYGARPSVFADAAALPFPDAVFDGVACLEVIEHVPDPQQVLREIARVLKPGGRAWVSMPFLYPLHDGPYDFQRYTEFGLARDAKRAGLRVVKLQRSLHAVRTAGLLLCLALAGGVVAGHSRIRWLWLPVVALAIPAINLSAWLLGCLWPDWTHLTAGHCVELERT